MRTGQGLLGRLPPRPGHGVERTHDRILRRICDHRRVEFDDVSVDTWEIVDDLLFQRVILGAVNVLRDRDGPPSLMDAVELVDHRVTHLMLTKPERFTVPLEGYGSGFYT